MIWRHACLSFCLSYHLSILIQLFLCPTMSGCLMAFHYVFPCVCVPPPTLMSSWHISALAFSWHVQRSWIVSSCVEWSVNCLLLGWVIQQLQTLFFGHVMRKEVLENIVMAGRISGGRGKGRPREFQLDNLRQWPGRIPSINTCDSEQGPTSMARYEGLQHLARYMMMIMSSKHFHHCLWYSSIELHSCIPQAHSFLPMKWMLLIHLHTLRCAL